MSEPDTRARWILPLVVALVALVTASLWLGSRASELEPGRDGRARLPPMDAGAGARIVDGSALASEQGVDGVSSGGSAAGPPEQDTLHMGRMDGAVRLHLPAPEPLPDQVVFSADELRLRRSAQIDLIEDRIEALDRQIGNAPASGMRPLLERRREHLIERRDVLIGTLLDPTE